MALFEKKLEVKVSVLPGAGKGFFTKELIPKGTRIMPARTRESRRGLQAGEFSPSRLEFSLQALESEFLFQPAIPNAGQLIFARA